MDSASVTVNSSVTLRCVFSARLTSLFACVSGRCLHVFSPHFLLLARVVNFPTALGKGRQNEVKQVQPPSQTLCFQSISRVSKLPGFFWFFFAVNLPEKLTEISNMALAVHRNLISFSSLRSSRNRYIPKQLNWHWLNVPCCTVN